MTTALEEMAGFIEVIESRPRLDILSNEQVDELRTVNFEEVFLRACKIIPSMMYTEFSRYTREEVFLDLVQAAALGVLRAVERWDPEGGSTMTTWAYRLARQEVLKELERDGRFASRHELQDFSDSFDDQDETVLHKNDTLGGPQGNAERRMEWETDYSLIRQGLAEDEQSILDLMREGYSQREIADECGINQTAVSRIVAKIQQKIVNQNRNFSDIT